jgi:hypothetical protein
MVSWRMYVATSFAAQHHLFSRRRLRAHAFVGATLAPTAN